MRKIYLLLAFLSMGFSLFAQSPNLSKMSPLVRELSLRHHANKAKGMPAKTPSMVCAFIRISGDADALLREHGAVSLAQFGDIHIANIPVQQLASLSRHATVSRIEAGRSHSLTMDSVATQINALPAYAGQNLPQAYTGAGVVLGMMDVGFDVTHPTFYDSTATTYRIKRFWDMLSPDSLSSTLYVGADYTTEDAIKAYGHSRDGHILTHGTHTLGTAAGSGYDSDYRGLAYESDICIVSNVVSNDQELIPESDYYKYTSATDALGFKYIFDYATSVNKPCVISFSEGSPQDFLGEEELFYEVLRQMTGEGRILVASAGNDASMFTYFHKPIGKESSGLYVFSIGSEVSCTMKSAQPFQFRLRMLDYNGNTAASHTISTANVVAQTDSILTETVTLNGKSHTFTLAAYKSCYNPEEIVYDILVQGGSYFGLFDDIVLEAVGSDADVEFFAGDGFYMTGEDDEEGLNSGDNTHCINSPGSSPDVICVGATGYRTSYVNYNGETQEETYGVNGERSSFSSIGPTLDGRIKPDVMAPGANIISSYSSYYMENNSTSEDLECVVEQFNFGGRTYGWAADTGTSMATPAVAGAIALWLQAKPTLTAEEVIEVFSRTCTQTDATATYPNNYTGYGQIDVYKGLLDILGLTKIESLSQTLTPVKISIGANGRLHLAFDAVTDSPLTVKVFSVDGIQRTSVQLNAGKTDYDIDLGYLPRGVYAVQVGGDNRFKGSTLIRR